MGGNADRNTSNASIINEKVSNNINNTKLAGWVKTDEIYLGMTNICEIDGNDNKVGVLLGSANYGGKNEDKIKGRWKAGVMAVSSTDNSVYSSVKMINQCIKLVSLMIAALIIANCVENYHLTIVKKILLITTTSTFDRFLAMFTIFTNTFLEKKTKNI